MLVPLNQSKYYMNKNQFIKTQLKIKIILITLVPLKQQMYLLTAYRNPWTLDARVERWTLDSERCTLDAGNWTLDAGLWTLDATLRTLHSGRYTLDSGRYTQDATLRTLHLGRYTLDATRWTLDATSQALGTKNSCQLVQNKIRTQFQFLILSRVQVLTLNVKCYVIKKYRNKFLL